MPCGFIRHALFQLSRPGPQTREQFMVHWGTAGQFGFEPGKLWRGLPLARCVSNVVAQETHREGTAPALAANATRGVQGQHVEEHRVAWGEFPAKDVPGAAVG